MKRGSGMPLNASISILVDKEGAMIEVTDEDSIVTFLEIKMTPENFMAALGRLCNCNCEATVRGLDKIGKRHEWKKLDFEIPEDLGRRDPEIFEYAKKACPEGWEPTNYFGSQDSFFRKDSKYYASTTIRRWVEKDE